jgi:hypothetical protein
MRTITKIIRLGDAFDKGTTLLDERVLVSYGGRYLKVNGDYHDKEINDQEANEHRFKNLRSYSRDCLIHFFTTEPPEERQARIEAMEPARKMAFLIYECPATSIPKVPNVSPAQLVSDFQSLLAGNLNQTNIRNQIIAYLLVNDLTVRSLMEEEQMRRFDDIINHCRGKITQATKAPAISKNLTSMVRQGY